jgi:hypothetical protein
MPDVLREGRISFYDDGGRGVIRDAPLVSTVPVPRIGEGVRLPGGVSVDPGLFRVVRVTHHYDPQGKTGAKLRGVSVGVRWTEE